MVEPMNWISVVVRPKIKTLFKRETPENLWVKCPDTGQMVFHKEVESNHWVIPGSEHHLKMSAQARLKMMFDEGTWIDVPLPEVAADPLKFRDEKRYVDRLKEARAKTGMADAFKVGFGRVAGLPMTIAAQEFGFMAGSLGMAGGEAFGGADVLRRERPGGPRAEAQAEGGEAGLGVGLGVADAGEARGEGLGRVRRVRRAGGAPPA